MAGTSLVLNPCSFAEIKNLINTFPPLPAPLQSPGQHKQLETIKARPLIIDKAETDRLEVTPHHRPPTSNTSTST